MGQRTPVREAAITGSGPDRIPLGDTILFIDGEAIVIDKPAGLPVDAPRAGGDSVAARLDELRFGFQRLPVPMHRLDRDTSGCLLLARNPKARARFAKTFETGEVGKVYLAVVEGRVEGEGVIDLRLAKVSSSEQGWRMVADEKGKAARTRWRALKSSGERTLIEFRPETGRTHQIRAHARYGLDAPIVGDPIYGRGGEPASTSFGQGMLLHAFRLLVPRTPKLAIDVTAPLPERFGEWRNGL